MDKNETEAKAKKGEDNPVKSMSLTPAITALFKPTADYVGQELRDTIKAYVEDKKNKRRERNLNEHLISVQNKLKNSDSTLEPEQKEPSLDQLNLYDEWIDNVQDIDVEDKELSKIWENLLAQAARGGAVQTEVLDAIKSITPREAQFLYEFADRAPPLPIKSGRVNSEDRYFANSLEGKGILEKDYAFSIMFITIIGATLAVFYFVLQEIAFSKISIIGPILAFAIVSLGFSLRAGISRWRLSWLGQTIIKFVKLNK